MAQMKKQPMPKKKTRVSDPKPKAPAKGKMYAGGTPFFNEMTGKKRKVSKPSDPMTQKINAAKQLGKTFKEVAAKKKKMK